METSFYPLALSAWGALLATILAVVRLWEFFSNDRLRLTTSYLISSNAEEGHTFTIENSSNRPVMVTYWELFWASRWLGRTWFDRGEAWPEEGSYDVTIPPHSRHQLNFAGQSYFKFRNEIDGRKVHLYLKLYLVGRKKPVILFLY